MLFMEIVVFHYENHIELACGLCDGDRFIKKLLEGQIVTDWN
jgi:hypothetical protein